MALATGQYLYFGLEEQGDITIADYLAMAESKTALTVCACEIGALTASATDVQHKDLRLFGRHLSLSHYMHSSIRRDWNKDRSIDAVGARLLQKDKRDYIERLAQKQKIRAIETLDKGDLKGPVVQALCELAQIPFSNESLLRLIYDVETIPCL